MPTTRSKKAAAGSYFSSWKKTKPSITNQPGHTRSSGSRIVRGRPSYYINSDSESDTSDDLKDEANNRTDEIVVCKSKRRNDTGVEPCESSKYKKMKTAEPVTEDDEITKVNSKVELLIKALPIEVHQNIADYLPHDADVYSYILICKATSISINHSVWRLRAIRTFDVSEGTDIKDLVVKYAFRQHVSRKWVCFDPRKLGGRFDNDTRHLQLTQATHCMGMLKGLILESNAKQVHDEAGNMVTQGLNLQYIGDLLCGRNGRSYVDILDSLLNTLFDRGYMTNCGREALDFACGFTARPDEETMLLYTVQLCLTSFILHPDYCQDNVSHFDLSQFTVYAFDHMYPTFGGKFRNHINARWLIHAVNFFKYHLKADGEGILAHDYKNLPTDQYPQPWIGRLQRGTKPLHQHWKGAHSKYIHWHPLSPAYQVQAYMDPNELNDLRLLRNHPKELLGRKIYPDTLDGDETFFDISMFFDETQFSKSMWPKNWEAILESDPWRILDKSGRKPNGLKWTEVPPRPDVKYFWGSSRGTNTGHFFGAIHACSEHQGVPGFQRIVLMKFYAAIVDGEEVYDRNQVWAYEGAVLPGGNIIIGRWWDANNTTYHGKDGGPFIWWNVHRSDATPPIDPQEAFKFLETVPVENIHL